MRPKFYIAFILLFFTLNGYSQKDRHLWYFGNGVGLDFRGDTVVRINDSQLYTKEGCASICNDEGDLLFYTDGNQIWDKNHHDITKFENLNGGYSSTQSAVIVKKPRSEEIYYIFTASPESIMGEQGSGVTYSVIHAPFADDEHFSEYNEVMADVATEKIAVLPHANQTDYWIVIHLFDSNTFEAYLLSENGFDLNPIQSHIGSIINQGTYNPPLPIADDTTYGGIGYLKASLDGSLLVNVITEQGKIELFDFDNVNGTVSNTRQIGNYDPIEPYGVEFSSNNQFLYVSNNITGTISQYALQAGSAEDITNSEYIIPAIPDHPSAGALQIGPDYKIYFTAGNLNHLPRIENPNQAGAACDFNETGIALWGIATLGLPLYIPRQPEPVDPVDSTLFEMPTGFSPNGDGLNELFIPLWNLSYLEGTIEIFNRRGRRVYQHDDINFGWDGDDNTWIMPVGTYFWVFNVRTEDHPIKVYRGFVVLSR